MTNILTVDHHGFRRFYDQLAQAVPDVPDCNNTRHHATRLLRELGYDVEGSLAHFAERGGCCCDCEVLMNVPPRWPLLPPSP